MVDYQGSTLPIFVHGCHHNMCAIARASVTRLELRYFLSSYLTNYGCSSMWDCLVGFMAKALFTIGVDVFSMLEVLLLLRSNDLMKTLMLRLECRLLLLVEE